MDSDSLWAQSAQQFQQIFGESWSRALQSFQQIEPQGVAGTASEIKLAPDKLQELNKQYVEEAGKLWLQGLQGVPAPQPSDKRFAGQGWAENPVAAFSAAAYLLNARTLMGLADAV